MASAASNSDSMLLPTTPDELEYVGDLPQCNKNSGVSGQAEVAVFVKKTSTIRTRSKCAHGRRRSRCRDCGAKSFCEHGRQRCRCKECGGSNLCEHRYSLFFPSAPKLEFLSRLLSVCNCRIILLTIHLQCKLMPARNKPTEDTMSRLWWRLYLYSWATGNALPHHQSPLRYFKCSTQCNPCSLALTKSARNAAIAEADRSVNIKDGARNANPVAVKYTKRVF